MNVIILYGTESGNAEMVADDVAEFLGDNDFDATVTAMDDFDVTGFDDLTAGDTRLLLITSTYGEGGLPATAEPLHSELSGSRPDLTGIEFLAFGLGDSTYETYNNAVDVLSAAFTDLGARLVGEIGRHDAASGEDPSEIAIDWARVALVESAALAV
ncbi:MULTISPECIES: flavodoxin domain-containing protein [Gordonia]|uniref:flavodoxin domain-containing protein n=1 Tax=Gordonia TaxID=2053 RepID=UPI00133195DE|nr:MULTISPECIES: flavodoxin family protein [Gordonia]KAF0970949.1 Cindoxin [Gordonia sp. YY1]MCZ4580120.1 flavodoxin family protein [Gordonia amicalis]